MREVLWALAVFAGFSVVASVVVVLAAARVAGRADASMAAARLSDGDDHDREAVPATHRVAGGPAADGTFEVVVGVVSTQQSGVRRAASLPPVVVSDVLGVTSPQHAEALVRQAVESFLATAGADRAEVLVSAVPAGASPPGRGHIVA